MDEPTRIFQERHLQLLPSELFIARLFYPRSGCGAEMAVEVEEMKAVVEADVVVGAGEAVVMEEGEVVVGRGR